MSSTAGQPGRRLPSCPRLPSELIVVTLALVGLGATAMAGGLDGLRIDAPGLVVPVAVGAAAGLVVVVTRPTRRWWTRTLPVLVIAAAGVEAGLAWYLRASGTIVDAFPWTFHLWAGLALLAPATLVAGWRTAGRGRRSVGLVAVPLTAAAAFLLINSHYGYWPTLGDLLGHPMSGQITAATLHRELAATGPTSSRPTPVDWHDARDERGAQQAADDRAEARRPAAPALVGSDLARVVAGGAPRPAPTTGPGASAPTTDPAPATGQFAAVQIPATVSHFVHRWDYVYLPPAYFSARRSELGVVVLLAGTPSSPDIWATGGAAVATADAYARQHQGMAPVLLFVDANGSWSGDTECVNGPEGQAETYLTRDVVRFAVDTLHLSADPARWGIVGFSEGGTCAYDLALRHPTLFHHFVDLAGDAAPNVAGSTLRLLFGGSSRAMRQHEPSWLLRHPMGSYRDLTAWFGVGVGDTRHLRLGARQAEAARRAGIRTTWFTGPDGHDWQFCSWALRRLLPGLATQVDLTPTIGRPVRRPTRPTDHNTRRRTPAAGPPRTGATTTTDPATRA